MKKMSIAICLATGMAWPQDATRQIWDTGFLQKRPTASKGKPANASSAPLQYETKAAPSEQQQATQAVIGLTLWHLRTAGANDDTNARLLLQDQPSDSGPKPFVPERIDLSQPLYEGERIRLSVESPRAGFLYVIDRERYSDGSVGSPFLIFPARNFSYGVNDVEPGRIVEIPPQNSKIPALKVARSNERHIGEELLIVVTKEPLPDLAIQDAETKLSPERVSQWEKEWGVTAMRLDLAATPHASWTPAEKDAGAQRHLLTQDDPMPATIFSVPPVENKPLLLHIPLQLQNR